MALRLAIGLLLVVLYAWVIVATWPYRLNVIRDAKQNDYYESLERRFNYAKNQYETLQANPNPNKDELIEAQEKYALLLWEKKDFLKAMEMFQTIVAQRKPADAEPYDEKWVQSMLRLAGIYRDLSNFDAAQATYTEVLDYDRKKEPESTKIARDLNNLGLLSYMKATSEKEEPKRQEFMKTASGLLNEAIKIYQEKLGPQSPSEAISLWNLYLVERDLGNEKLSQELRSRAEAIDEKMNRACKAP